MRDAGSGTERRRFFVAMAGLALGMAAARTADAMVPKNAPPGKPGDFDFLQGSWKIRNRKLKSPGVWDEFDGESTCFSILGGVVSVEELRLPARDFGGMGLRTLDVQKKVWSDIWMNAKSGVVVSPGATGYFENGAGIFDEDDEEDGKPVRYRGIWDEITPASCRWRQGTSRDGGKTWEYNWIMNWTRA
jgi:hypothetical protein